MELYMNGFVIAPLPDMIALLQQHGARTLTNITPSIDEDTASRITTGAQPSLAVSYRWRCGDSYNQPMFAHYQLSKLNMAIQAFQMRHGYNATVALWIDKVYHVRTGRIVHNLPWVEQGLMPYFRHEVVMFDKCVEDGTTNFWTMAEHAISYSSASGGMKLNYKFGDNAVCNHETHRTNFEGSLIRVCTLWTLLTATNGRFRFRDDDGTIKALLSKRSCDVASLHPSDSLTYIPSAGSSCANVIRGHRYNAGFVPFSYLRVRGVRMVLVGGNTYLVQYDTWAFVCKQTALAHVWHVYGDMLDAKTLQKKREVDVADYVLFGSELEQTVLDMIRSADWKAQLNELNRLAKCGPNNWVHLSEQNNYLGVKLEPFGNDKIVLLPGRLLAGIQSQSKEQISTLSCEDDTKQRLRVYLGVDEIECTWTEGGFTYLECKQRASGDCKVIRGRDGEIRHDVFEGMTKEMLGQVLATFLAVSSKISIFDRVDTRRNYSDFVSLLGDKQDWNKHDWAYIAALTLYEQRRTAVSKLYVSNDQEEQPEPKIKLSRYGVRYNANKQTGFLLLAAWVSGVALIVIAATVKKFNDSLLEVIIAVVALNFLTGTALVLKHYEGGNNLVGCICGRRRLVNLPSGYELDATQSAQVAGSRWLTNEDIDRLSGRHACYFSDAMNGDIDMSPLPARMLRAVGYDFVRNDEGRLIVRKDLRVLFWDGVEKDTLLLRPLKRSLTVEEEHIPLRGSVCFGNDTV